MEKPTIAQKKPFILDMTPGTYYWCACGKSSNQPFCDGSNKVTAFTPIKTEIAEQKKVAWCGCKQSANKPFCDGAHINL